jgi:hypothetical protein
MAETIRKTKLDTPDVISIQKSAKDVVDGFLTEIDASKRPREDRVL